MKKWKLASLAAIFVLAGTFAVSADSISRDQKEDKDVREAIELFKKSDSSLEKLFGSAYGYVVFPSVGKGAVGVGAAAGDGLVFEKGNLIGTARLTQVTIGAQLGGQEFAEVIFFEDKDGLDRFKESKLEMSAGVSAVAAAEGASANAKYKQGVVIFTVAKSGLMFEASVGGQKFKFAPLEKK